MAAGSERFLVLGRVAEHGLEPVAQLLKHLRGAPIPERLAGSTELCLLVGQQPSPRGRLLWSLAALSFCWSRALRRCQVVDLAQPVLHGLDGRVKPGPELVWERPGEEFHGIAQFLAADAELVQGRLIRPVGRDGREELFDHGTECDPGPSPRSEPMRPWPCPRPGTAPSAGVCRSACAKTMAVPQPLVDGNDRLLRFLSLGPDRLQPALRPAAGLLLLQPLDEYVAVAGVIGGPANPLELLFHPRKPTARHQVLVQAQRRRGPSSPDAQLVDVADVFIGLLGRQGQELKDGAEPALQRPHHDITGPITSGHALNPFLRSTPLPSDLSQTNAPWGPGCDYLGSAYSLEGTVATIVPQS